MGSSQPWILYTESTLVLFELSRKLTASVLHRQKDVQSGVLDNLPGMTHWTALPACNAQHGVTVMQKLVEAKLKRVHQEGLAERVPRQQLARLQDVAEHQSEAGDADALADANMAALLEQVQLEDQGCALQLERNRSCNVLVCDH